MNFIFSWGLLFWILIGFVLTPVINSNRQNEMGSFLAYGAALLLALFGVLQAVAWLKNKEEDGKTWVTAPLRQESKR